MSASREECFDHDGWKVWLKFAWRLATWPLAGVFVLTTDGGWQVVWVVYMVTVGLVLEGIRFAGDRLIAIQRDAIKLRDGEISHLQRYRQAIAYARGEHRIKPPHLRGES